MTNKTETPEIKLRLNKDSIRRLSDGELVNAAGGNLGTNLETDCKCDDLCTQVTS